MRPIEWGTKSQGAPGHWDSYSFAESFTASNAAGVAVLYFEDSARSGSGQAKWRSTQTKRAVGAWTRGVTDMGEQVRELFNWARRRKILAAVFVAFTLAVGILIGSVVSGRVAATKSLGFSGTTATALTVPDPVPSSSSFASIVNRVEPAVVNIATTQVLERKQSSKKPRRQPYDQEDPMQDFFDRFFDGRQDGPPQAERSLGSGVIVDKRGYILTNNHVVEQATKIQVQLNGDATKYTAKVIGVAEATNLPGIRIDANKELPSPKLRNSHAVQFPHRFLP